MKHKIILKTIFATSTLFLDHFREINNFKHTLKITHNKLQFSYSSNPWSFSTLNMLLELGPKAIKNFHFRQKRLVKIPPFIPQLNEDN